MGMTAPNERLSPDLQATRASGHLLHKTDHKATHLEESVPAACAQSLAVAGNTNTRDTVLVASELTSKSTSADIPHVAVVVVVAGEKEATAGGEANRGDTAEDLVVAVSVELQAQACKEDANADSK